mgnify:CR=1 FL=1
MSGVNVLEAVVEILERWGWVQHAAVAAGGFDIVGAFEESTGVPLRNLAADEDAARLSRMNQTMRQVARRPSSVTSITSSVSAT